MYIILTWGTRISQNLDSFFATARLEYFSCLFFSALLLSQPAWIFFLAAVKGWVLIMGKA